MIAKYVQPGEVMDYVATKAVALGDVVNLSSRIGIAANNINAGEVGAVQVCGVFELPRDSGEGAVDIACGTALYWDMTNKAITATVPEAEATDKLPAGYAFAAAAKSASTVLVKLLG